MSLQQVYLKRVQPLITALQIKLNLAIAKWKNGTLTL